MSRPALLAFAALAVLCSCGRRPADTPLRVVLRTPPLSLDPQTTDDFSTLTVLENIYEPLVRFDRELRLVPQLARSWTNPSQTTWRFELRRGVRFQDGRALSAQDVEFTIARALTHQESWVRSRIPLVEAAHARGDDTVDIVTREPAPLLLNQLAEVMVLPRGSEGSLERHPNGTGPYRLAAWAAGREADLERFDGYWGTRPRWSRAAFRAEPDGGRRLDAILEGAADVGEAPALGDLPRLARSPRAQLVRQPGLSLAILGLNVEPGGGNPFADAAVRRAVSLALDRRALVEEAYAGMAAPASQLAPGPVFGHVPDLPPLEHDGDAAREALRTSRFPEGFTETLSFTERDRRAALLIARQAAGLGILLETRERTWEELDHLMMTRRARAYLFYMTFPTLDTSDLLLSGFHARSADRRYGMLNFSGYSDPEMDRLLERSDGELDSPSRYALLRRAMEKAVAANAWLPLCVPDTLFAARKGLVLRPTASGRVALGEIGQRQ